MRTRLCHCAVCAGSAYVPREFGCPASVLTGKVLSVRKAVPFPLWQGISVCTIESVGFPPLDGEGEICKCAVLLWFYSLFCFLPLFYLISCTTLQGGDAVLPHVSGLAWFRAVAGLWVGNQRSVSASEAAAH